MSEPTKVFLKDYSKVILYYPLLIYSVIALIIQLFIPPSDVLAIIWVFVFLFNTVTVGFNFPTVKFFLLFLSFIIIGLTLILLDIGGVINLFAWWTSIRPFFDFPLASHFYGWMVFIFGLIIVAAIVVAQFRFVKIEKNEIYVRGLATGKANRYPTGPVKIYMEIIDIFEYITIGAGMIKVFVQPDNVLEFHTVPFVRKKRKAIDELLSTTLVEKVR
ncbi:MAG: hypothetical protein JW776_15990 [Candidatus Lokiarchaeota archaeon]|nr:hypothetical protein [Candidatus Lokiarchaeota archaeon]